MNVNQITGNRLTSTFDSLAEWADYAEPFIDIMTRRTYSTNMEWRFGSEDTRYRMTDALDMSRYGWEYHQDTVLALTDEVAEEVRELTTQVFTPVWDFSGS